MHHGSPRGDRVRGRFRNQPSEGKHDTPETSIRPGSGLLVSGLLAGRCVLYPPHSTPLLPPDGIEFTDLVNSRIVGKPEGIRLLPHRPSPALNRGPASTDKASQFRQADKLGDEFTYRYKNVHHCKMKLEAVAQPICGPIESIT
jgi:hypothetical protein